MFVNLPGSGNLPLGKAHIDCPLLESWRGHSGGKEVEKTLAVLGK